MFDREYLLILRERKRGNKVEIIIIVVIEVIMVKMGSEVWDLGYL